MPEKRRARPERARRPRRREGIWSLAIHGGAGNARPRGAEPERERVLHATLTGVLEAGARSLAAGGTSLDAVEAAVPAGKLVHAILDNYGSHKHPKVRRWLERHRRWTFHYTPTSGSWLNAVETFFSALTRRRLRRGAFHSLVDLQAAINRYLAEHNADPKPFIWTATPKKILNKLQPLNASMH